MAQDPASVHQVGIQAPYQFMPTHYYPPGVNVPTEAGKLWSQAGASALGAAEGTFKTAMAINPAVRAKIKEMQSKSQLSQEDLQWLHDNPAWAHALYTSSPEGGGWRAPAEVPVATNLNLGVPDLGSLGGTGQSGRMKFTGPGTMVDTVTNTPYYYDETAKQWRPGTRASQQQPSGSSGGSGSSTPANKAPADSGPPSPSEQAKPPPPPPQSSTSQPSDYSLADYSGEEPPGAPGFSMASGYPDYPYGYGFFGGQDNSDGSGVIHAQGGGLIPGPGGPPMAQPGMPPPAPAQAMPPPQMMPSQGGPPMPPQQSMHPVMSSQTALELAKSFDTSASRAVYIPSIPPTGEPGFAFFGPKNKSLGPPVTISMLVKHGGAGLVAGENLSTVLNVAGAGHPQSPGMLPAGHPGMGPGQRPPEHFAQGGEVYPAVANDPSAVADQPPAQPAQPAQPDPGAVAAGAPPSAPGAYNPEPYRQAVAAATSDPRNLTAQTANAGTPAQPQTFPEPALPPVKNTPASSDPDLARQAQEYDADADLQKPNREWVYGPDGKPLYLPLPSDKGGFWEKRFYRATNTFEDGIWSNDKWKRQQMLDDYSGATGPPTDKIFNFDAIKDLPIETVNAYNARSRWWKNTTPMQSSDPDAQVINSEMWASRYLQRILDADQATKAAKVPYAAYGPAEQGYSNQVAARNSALGITQTDSGTVPPSERISTVQVPPVPKQVSIFPESWFPGIFRPFNELPTEGGRLWNAAQGAFHGYWSGGRQSTNPVADDMAENVKNLTSTLSNLEQYKRQADATQQTGPSIGVGANVEGIGAQVSHHLPIQQDPSGLKELNTMLQGGDHDAAIDAVRRRLADINSDLVNRTNRATLGLKRVPDDLTAASRDLVSGNAITDTGSGYRDKDGIVGLPAHYRHPYGDYPMPAGTANTEGFQVSPTGGTADQPRRYVNPAPAPTPTPSPTPSGSPPAAPGRHFSMGITSVNGQPPLTATQQQANDSPVGRENAQPGQYYWQDASKKKLKLRQ